jgi:hypothetical protein
MPGSTHVTTLYFAPFTSVSESTAPATDKKHHLHGYWQQMCKKWGAVPALPQDNWLRADVGLPPVATPALELSLHLKI